MNIKALKKIDPNFEFHTIEINKKALPYLKQLLPEENIIIDSILDFKSLKKWDLVLIKGVLNHINPEMLQRIVASICKVMAFKKPCVTVFYLEF